MSHRTSSMTIRTLTFNIEIFAAASAALIVCGTAAGQTIIPVDQGRSVSNQMVNALQCSDEYFSDVEAAAGFEPFDAFVQTEHGCDAGFACATTGQQSQIDSASMTASGTATSEAQGPDPGHMHAFSISHFEVTFELPSSSSFALDGTMTAGTLPDGKVETVLAGVLATLWGGPNLDVLLFEQSLQAPPGGGTDKQVLEAAGTLEPGVYSLDVQAGSYVEGLNVPPNRLGQASFDFTFVVTILGDLNGDEIVGAGDLLILLANWGRCADCDDCNADIDGNCTVGASDLLILLSNWG
ncbi:MAG: hypothetical protein V3T53_14575 [Phycisphaerales bacterium]